MKKIHNIAFVDGQNLHLGTQSEGWIIDFKKFYIHLKDKYKIKFANFYIGHYVSENDFLYEKIKNAGFNLIFRDHNENQKGTKKGNVDVDIVFDVMEKIIKKKEFDKIILVSGDGDYFRIVNFLIKNGLFGKILFPNTKRSSLYKKITRHFGTYLNEKGIKEKIGINKKGRGLA
ncbi:NYN domain-containing protein [Candidatus Gracilibacteria bacterium]|nr:NYN domain-containing protein [Candidatus Gracilibacteria bacterium]